MLYYIKFLHERDVVTEERLILLHGGAFPSCRPTKLIAASDWDACHSTNISDILFWNFPRSTTQQPLSSGSAETTHAAPPCDSNWVIRCNSISNRRAMRVSLRCKAKEHLWVGPLSVPLHHRCYLSGCITRPALLLASSPGADPSALIV